VNILFATAEVAPFAKTGGLGDVSAALPRQLHRHGHDVRVFLPFYARVATDGRHFEAVEGVRDVEVRLGRHHHRFSLLRAPLPGSDLPIYFVHCPALYHRAAIYTMDDDEHLRFLLLQRAALESAQRMGFAPDIVHANDWQTALLPLMLNTLYAWDRRIFGRTRTVLTIHNLQYQGVFRADVLHDTGMHESAHLFHQDQLREGRLGFLTTGILYADLISTVSPTYAREIQTPEQGAGVDGLLRQRGNAVVGILNGVDYDEWSPEADRLIPFRYSPLDLGPKERNKEVLLRSLGLPYVPGVPVTGMVSRLAGQKGLELLFDVAPGLLARQDAQLVVLGSGEHRYEEFFRGLQHAFPRKVCFYNGYNNELAHLIEAGADMFLMPSRYEPCGLNQLYSLRYGTVPIVRRTGGLADTVDADTGFVFERYAADALRSAWELALRTYRDRAGWRRLMLNGMARSTSWETQAARYEDAYRRLAGGR
jgi:starch synthase